MELEEFKLYIEHFRPNQQKILLGIAGGVSNQVAATVSGVAESNIYKWQNDDAEFEKAIKIAREISVKAIEEILTKCAQKAVDDPRYTKSVEFLLKSRKRDVYGDHVVQEVKTENKPFEIILTENNGSCDTPSEPEQNIQDK